jgi:hypothetical protein
MAYLDHDKVTSEAAFLFCCRKVGIIAKRALGKGLLYVPVNSLPSRVNPPTASSYYFLTSRDPRNRVGVSDNKAGAVAFKVAISINTPYLAERSYGTVPELITPCRLRSRGRSVLSPCFRCKPPKEA